MNLDQQLETQINRGVSSGDGTETNINENIGKKKCGHAEKEQGTGELVSDLCKCKIYAAITHLQTVWYSRL